jgi:hypothetical protein
MVLLPSRARESVPGRAADNTLFDHDPLVTSLAALGGLQGEQEG